jgi:hypothetical protein
MLMARDVISVEDKMSYKCMSDSNKNVPLDYMPCGKDDNVSVHDDVVHENVYDISNYDNDVILIDNESEHENFNENVAENEGGVVMEEHRYPLRDRRPREFPDHVVYYTVRKENIRRLSVK